jgi:hypothetical protein
LGAILKWVWNPFKKEESGNRSSESNGNRGGSSQVRQRAEFPG